MAHELVSVIIPCFHQAQFLGGALDCVLAQSYRPVQPIVISDGPDDDARAVVRRYGEQVQYLAQAHQGPSAARNTGIRAARGEYLLFLDADDLLHPDALAWQMKAMGGRVDRLCVMGYRLFQQDPDQDGRDELSALTHGSLLPALIHRNFGPPHCFLSPRKLVVETGNFDEGLLGVEDWDLWLRIALRGADLKTVVRAGAYYRRHPDSLSAHQPRMLKGRVELLVKVYHWFTEEPARLERWGAELIEAMHQVRRCCRAQGADPDQITALSRCIRELDARGFRRRESLLKRTLGAAVGRETAERLSFAVGRRLFPGRFLAYTRRYW